jgi:hypothetical protein
MLWCVVVTVVVKKATDYKDNRLKTNNVDVVVVHALSLSSKLFLIPPPLVSAFF